MRWSTLLLALVVLLAAAPAARSQNGTANAAGQNSTTQPSSSSPTALQGFVRAKGTQFMLNGAPFYFGGTNGRPLIHMESYTRDQIVQYFSGQAAVGARVVRLFAFVDGYGGVPDSQTPTPDPIQPTVGVFNETVLEYLDFILAQAAAAGILLILPLVNYENDLGGMQWYVDQALGTNPQQVLEVFYTDSNVKAAYKAYVTMLLNRVNTITGLAYRDDPVIMAWELANEPHTTDLYEKDLGLTPGALVLAWLDEMSTFVKSIDSNHLLGTGEEGWRADGPDVGDIFDWVNGGFKGVDFVKNVQLPNIDYATIHVYPDNWNIPATSSEPDGANFTWVIPNYIWDRGNISFAAGKPIVMEEFGVRPGYMPSRNDVLEPLGLAAIDAGFGGVLVWDAWPWPIDATSGDTYSFGYMQDGGTTMLDLYGLMKAKSS